MNDINHVLISGRLTRDAELKYTNTGYPLTKFAIAANRYVKRNGEGSEDVSFFNCTLWGKLGEAVHQYLLKGRAVMLDGYLRQNRWQDNDGNAKSVIEIIVEDLKLMGGQGQGKAQGDNRLGKSDNVQNSPPVDADSFEDDIPF